MLTSAVNLMRWVVQFLLSACAVYPCTGSETQSILRGCLQFWYYTVCLGDVVVSALDLRRQIRTSEGLWFKAGLCVVLFP